MAELDIRILGSLEVREGERSLPLGGAKQRAVLALLLLDAGRVVSTDRLVDELWPEHPPGRPQTAVQGYVSELRKLIERKRKPGTPSQVLTTQGPGYLLRLEPEQLDLRRFERLFEEGKEALAEGRPESAATRLREALSLWRGPALADFTYEPWAQAAIARLEELRLACLEARLEADLALGRQGALVGELEALIGEHPLRERLRGQLMLALYRSGRQAEALDAYQQARRTLVDQLGIEPSTELQELHRAILRQEAGLVVEPPPKLPTPSLPAPATPLVGRRRELAELHALLARPDVRLITLTGAGGSGKTRLALTLCEERAAGSGEGVCFCELAPITDPALVLPTVAQALGVKEAGGEPLLERLTALLHDRPLLLCLDNLEQVLEAAADFAELLAAAPALRLLATSRERLRLRAEHEYPLEPLPLPGREALSHLEALAQVDAVALFLQRARAARPDFRLTAENAAAVTEICRRLDGLPLALELAAARIKLLPPDVLLGRLEHSLELLTGGARDLPARQQTLRATIEWSYGLLTDNEQRLFARLAVFVGGCTLEAAEQVCEADLDTLQSLVDKSLLRCSNQRYRMLETIREYAADLLDQAANARELRRKHAEHFLGLDGQAKLGFRLSPYQEAWLDRLEADHDNLRAALSWGLDTGEAELVLGASLGLSVFWSLRDHVVEGRHWSENVLDRFGDVRAGADLTARGLLAAARAALFTDDFELARERNEQALALLREVGDEAGVAVSLMALGMSVQPDDPVRADELYAESLALFDRLGHDERIAGVLHLRGELARDLGEFARAEDLLRRSTEISRKMGLGSLLAGTIGGLADLMLDQGRFDEAQTLYAESIDRAREHGIKRILQQGVAGLAACAAETGEPVRAGRLWGAAESLEVELGVQMLSFERARYESSLRRLEGDPAFEHGVVTGRTMTLDAAAAYALAPVG